MFTEYWNDPFRGVPYQLKHAYNSYYNKKINTFDIYLYVHIIDVIFIFEKFGPHNNKIKNC